MRYIKMEMKKLYSIGGAILIGAAGLGVGFLLDTPDTIVETHTIEVEKEVFIDVPGEVQLVEVPVDNGDMAWAFERLEDKAIIEDAEEILAELKAEDAALELVLSSFDESEIFDELEDEDLIDDEDEVSLIKIYSDFEDVTVLKSDFEDEEYKFKIKFKVDDDGDKKYFFATYSVEDGDVTLENLQ